MAFPMFLFLVCIRYCSLTKIKIQNKQRLKQLYYTHAVGNRPDALPKYVIIEMHRSSQNLPHKAF